MSSTETKYSDPVVFFNDNAYNVYKPYINDFLGLTDAVRDVTAADVLTGVEIDWNASGDHMTCSVTWTKDDISILIVQVSYTQDNLKDLKMPTVTVANPKLVVTEEGLNYTSQEMLDEITKLFYNNTVKYVDDQEGVSVLISTAEAGDGMYANVILFIPKDTFTLRGDI